MTIQKRSMFVGFVFALALMLYGIARIYSPALVLYVVEQTMVQKAPSGSDPALLRSRLHDFLAEAPDQGAKMERLFQISAYLEKVQTVTPQELDRLLETKKPTTAPSDKSQLRRKSGTFSCFTMS
jgi:hypothetical protein